MFLAAQALLEVDRFFAGPCNRTRVPFDAQSAAIERLVRRCEEIRPYLESTASLELFIRLQHDPARVHRRISLALAIELSHTELVYGRIGRRELEAFRAIARHKLAALVWVLS
jgi:hypothetical protein